MEWSSHESSLFKWIEWDRSWRTLVFGNEQTIQSKLWKINFWTDAHLDEHYFYGLCRLMRGSIPLFIFGSKQIPILLHITILLHKTERSISYILIFDALFQALAKWVKTLTKLQRAYLVLIEINRSCFIVLVERFKTVMGGVEPRPCSLFLEKSVINIEGSGCVGGVHRNWGLTIDIQCLLSK